MSILFDHEFETLFDLARKSGLSDVEVFARKDSGVNIRIHKGTVETFQRSDSIGLGLRVLLGERVGYAYTENLSAEALKRVLTEAAANAEVVEPQAGSALATEEALEPAPVLYNQALDTVSLAEKIALAKAMDNAAYASDERVKSVSGCNYSDGTSFLRIANSRGLDRHYHANMAHALIFPIVSDGAQNKTYLELKASRDFADLHPVAMAQAAVHGAVGRLGAREPKSGQYVVVFHSKAITELMSAFEDLFSAKAALEGKSLLAGKEGATIATPLVSLVDDPLLEGGLASRPFDAEGVPSRARTLVEAGVFQGFLHNTQTARLAGIASTGHASRGSYKGTVGIAPSNFYIQAGESDFSELVAGEQVIVIDDLQGTHAGTNAVSGDFSLQAQGTLYENGKRQHPVHNFTVSGNFLAMLSMVKAVGEDLTFYPKGAYIGAPSVRVEKLAIAGS